MFWTAAPIILADPWRNVGFLYWAGTVQAPGSQLGHQGQGYRPSAKTELNCQRHPAARSSRFALERIPEEGVQREEQPMKLDKLGVWASLDGMTAAAGLEIAQHIEHCGYGALWMPESRGRNVLVHAAWLLAGTSKLVVASGIANIYARDAIAMASGQRGLNEQSDGRFLLGVGVSHAPIVNTFRGHVYGKPVATMRAYLEAMGKAPYSAPPPPEPPRTLVAALGPGMLTLAAELADGAHPYNVPPQHTAEARRLLGPEKLLCPEQMVVLETNPSEARRLARAALSRYLELDNYMNNWRRLGFGDKDLAGGGSDRFVDTIVAWGDEVAIRARIQEHWDAGADHVCVQPISFEASRQTLDERIIELLAPTPPAN
jgi:probable F420-dependent oxidoreductase